MVLLIAGCTLDTFRFAPGREPEGLPNDTGVRDTAPVTEPPDAAPPVLCINELMANNVNSVAGEQGTPQDWVELHNPTDGAVSLDGWTLGEDTRTPLDGLSLGAGAYLLIWADGVDASGHLPESLDADGGTLKLADALGGEAKLSFGAMEADWSAARSTPCGAEWRWDWHGTPGYTNDGATTTTLIPAGATWSWWDAGTAPDAAWTTLDFDDSAWASGPAPLGYGDTDIVSTVSYGPSTDARYVTTWFRHRFSSTGVPEEATLTLSVDDGAIVMLNGQEVARINVPAYGVGADTYASATIPAETAWWSFTVPADAIVAGDNILTAEVHQASASSSDVRWDASLTARMP